MMREYVTLGAVLPTYFEQIYGWCTAPEVAQTWRYRGSTPSPETFAHDLWQGVLCQYLAYDTSSGEPVGLVSLYDANLASRRAFVSCLIAPAWHSTGVATEAMRLILRHGFDSWPLDKVYMETNSFAIQAFQSAIRVGIFVEEARLVDFETFGTGTSDLIYLSVSRSDFRQIDSIDR